MVHLVVIAVAGLLLWLAINRFEWMRLRREQYLQTEQALFEELCQAHDLSRTDRQLLLRIAQANGNGPSCRIFVDPRVIQKFSKNSSADAGNDQNLFRRLFGN